MYGKNGVESDGDLYRMQQDAIRQARESARNATLPPEIPRRNIHREEQRQPQCPAPKSHRKHKDGCETKGLSSIFSGMFSNFSMEDILLLGLLILLLMDDADDEIIMIVMFLFVCGLL